MKSQSTAEIEAPKAPEMFELEHRGHAKFPKTEYENLSAEEIGRRVDAGRLTGLEHVRRGAGELMTVTALLRLAESGTLTARPSTAPESPPAQTVTVEALQSALAEVSKQIAADDEWGTKISYATRELRGLEHGGDLLDPRTQAQISKLQAAIALAPGQADARQQARARAKAELLDCCHQFVRSSLRPRLLAMQGRAAQVVKDKLAAHFDAPESLNAAISLSTVLTKIESILHSATIAVCDPQEAVRLAQQLLQSWSAANQFESEHLK